MARSTKKKKKERSSEETPKATPSAQDSSPDRGVVAHSSKKKKKEKRQEDATASKQTLPLETRTPVKDKTEDGAKSKKKKRKHDTPEPTTKPPTTASSLDVRVHRVRCLSYQPRPILCMASCNQYLALARDDGSVELKCGAEKYRTLTTIHGQPSRPVHVMVWTSDGAENVCVGGSMDGTIFVVNWKHNTLSNVIPSGGGGVLSLASHDDPCNQVAAGCEDGSIRIHDMRDNKLTLASTIATGGAAVLSLAWRKRAASSLSGNTLFAGLADGTIRRYDSREEQETTGWKSTLRMTVECLGRSTPTRVWSLLAIGSNAVVSGDSLGHVQFWDGDTGTLVSSCNQSESKADVLCLAASRNHKRVFASGVDSRIVCMELSTEHNKWILTHAQRPHTHDVKAIAICGEQLCSGGLDTKLCVYDTKFGKTRPKILYPWPAVSPITVAPEAKLLALKRQDRVDFLALDKTKTVDNNNNSAVTHINNIDSNMSTLEIKSSCNLACSDIHADGSLLAVSNALDGLMLFQLALDDNGAVIPTKVGLSSDMTWPCVALKFDPINQRLICATAGGAIVVLGVTIVDNQVSVEVQHKFDIPAEDGLFPIHSLHVSRDGAWLVSCQNGMNHHGTIHVFAVGTNNSNHFWTIPKMEAPHTCVEFLGNDNKLAVSCVNFGFYVFDIKEQKLSSWSESLGFPVTPSLPPELVNRNDYPVRFGFNKATPNKLLVGSFGAFCAIDFDKALPKHCRIFPETHVRGGKRQRQRLQQQQSEKDANHEDDENNHNCTVCLRYNSMLYMNFVEENELLVVEQPWLSVVATFPEALERKVYGS